MDRVEEIIEQFGQTRSRSMKEVRFYEEDKKLLAEILVLHER